jgi:hypothetical protein
MKTGKIKHIDPIGSWNDKEKYKVTFADGNQYTFFAIGEFKFKVGDEISYEITNEQYKNARIPQDQYSKENATPVNSTPKANYVTTSKDELIVKQTCIKAAAEFNAQRTGVDVNSIINDAQLMFNWITK